MSDEIFNLETQADEAGLCLTGLRKEWKELSEVKGWPITAEGWRRFLGRAVQTGKGPMKPKAKVIVSSVLPPAFLTWWKLHKHSGFVVGPDGTEYWNIPPRPAFSALRYRNEWEQGNTLRRAA